VNDESHDTDRNQCTEDVAPIRVTQPPITATRRLRWRVGDGLRAGAVRVGDALCAGGGLRAGAVRVGDALRAGALRGEGFLPGEWKRVCD
jgi:hypothetical protein